MVVKYYKSPDLKYASRKRYQTFNFEAFAQEEQKAILLGDGANTTVKTSVANICDYVTIDNTRWFVLYPTYMNGGQVMLYLQRDVFGENGVLDCFGKIERGYTETFLRNRKELSLNQILKKRTPLKPNTNKYGNYTVNNHIDELWGVLYLTKPTGLDPTTGQPYQDTVNITIPAFSPPVSNYAFIENNTTKAYKVSPYVFLSFDIKYAASIFNPLNEKCFSIDISFYQNGKFGLSFREIPKTDNVALRFTTITTAGFRTDFNDYSSLKNAIRDIGNKVANYIIRNQNTTGFGYIFPQYPEVTDTEYGKYNGVTIKKDDKFYEYSVEKVTTRVPGSVPTDNMVICNIIKNGLNGSSSDNSIVYSSLDSANDGYGIFRQSVCDVFNNVYTYKVLPNEQTGTLTIDVSKQLIDEPYYVLVFPLYNVNISGSKDYSIDRNNAFMIFNTVIQYLSGENPYLVDAQVYPYCPNLIEVSSEVKGYPFFSINSTSFITVSEVQLLPYSDIKKEYIERQYSIVSPEQSGNFVFNFYDYKNKINDTNGLNYEMLEVDIKTSLKPFSIIASAVINPDTDALNGITYDSDVRGCQPSSNGFECSLSSNAFQQYKRQNSNYQQIFALQKEELQKQHQVERVNEKTSGIVNTLSASMMGAIGGASLGSGPISKAIGGATGGLAAGTIVGSAMDKQYRENEKLRAYEESLQQQRFDLEIGTIKNLPNSVNRISSFNEIILKDFYFCIETYECSELEKKIVDNFIKKYSYGIGVFDLYSNYSEPGWFIRGTLITSNFDVNLHNIAETELKGGIYLYD